MFRINRNDDDKSLLFFFYFVSLFNTLLYVGRHRIWIFIYSNYSLFFFISTEIHWHIFHHNRNDTWTHRTAEKLSPSLEQFKPSFFLCVINLSYFLILVFSLFAHFFLFFISNFFFLLSSTNRKWIIQPNTNVIILSTSRMRKSLTITSKITWILNENYKYFEFRSETNAKCAIAMKSCL